MLVHAAYCMLIGWYAEEAVVLQTLDYLSDKWTKTSTVSFCHTRGGGQGVTVGDLRGAAGGCLGRTPAEGLCCGHGLTARLHQRRSPRRRPSARSMRPASSAAAVPGLRPTPDVSPGSAFQAVREHC